MVKQISAEPTQHEDAAMASQVTRVVALSGRVFNPDELDLDDLAEAVRLLLGSDATPQVAAIDSANRNLLPARPRGTHVVEARKAA